MLQRLGELRDEPLRIGDIATMELQMTAVTVGARSRNAASSSRDWAQRLASPHDRKAVFLAATPRGERQQKVIARTVDLFSPRIGRLQLLGSSRSGRRAAPRARRTWRDRHRRRPSARIREAGPQIAALGQLITSEIEAVGLAR